MPIHRSFEPRSQLGIRAANKASLAIETQLSFEATGFFQAIDFSRTFLQLSLS
jgi:hypothetical protein